MTQSINDKIISFIKIRIYHFLCLLCVGTLFLALCSGCQKESNPSPQPEPEPEPVIVDEKIIVLNEGSWQSDNGQLSYIFNGTISNKWFQQVNGQKLGDTPQDIVQINDNLLAISVNWSNIITYIRPDGTLVAQTEDIPNCRALCCSPDGKYLFVTSYAHETALKESYTKGYVAKIDVATFKVTATCEVGWEPEGIAWYNGKLFIANTGGYSYSEGHDYEHTVSVVDAGSMTLESTVEILREDLSPVVNLYGEMSQAGKWLCINSAGDYNTLPGATVIFNCEENTYTVYDFPSTYNTTVWSGKFFTVGAEFSYLTYENTIYVNTIDPESGEVTEGYMLEGGSVADNIMDDILALETPYCVYQNPYTGHLYIADAKSYSNAGVIHEYDTDGKKVASMSAYICPGHMVALP